MVTVDSAHVYTREFGASIQATARAIDLSLAQGGALVCLVDGDEGELAELSEAPPVQIDGAVIYWGIDLDGAQWRIAVPS